jgi:regulator of sigma E protease
MIDVAYKVVAFIFTLGVLVIFHELGHYLVARWCGVKVVRFSVGFGRVLVSRRLGRDGTEWALSALPLGGYVKFADEREGDVAAADLPRAFNRQSVWKRIAIVAAGPIANLLLAVALYAGTFVAGIPGLRPSLAEPPAGSAASAAGVREGDVVVAVDGEPVQSWQDLRWRLLRAQGRDSAMLALTKPDARPDATPVLRPLALDGVKPAEWEGDVSGALGLNLDLGVPIVNATIPGKPAERAGILAGDRIVAIDGVPVRSPGAAVALTNARPDKPTTFEIDRAGKMLDLTLTPEAVVRGERTVGQAGMMLKSDPEAAHNLAITVRYPIVDALAQGARKTWELSSFTLKMLGRIVTGAASLKNISGPLTMADFAGQSAQAGTLAFVGYLALISISLGVLNLLPVPLLDGGHLLYYFAEVVKGSPISDRAFEVGQRIGMAMLAVLMALALFNDVSRLF